MRRTLIAAAWLLVAVAAVYRWHASLGNPAHTTDFAPVWQAAGTVLHGGQLYAADRFGFVYLPAAAVLFLPFHALSLSTAASLSIALQLVAMAAACLIIVRRVRGPALLAPLSALVLIMSEATLSAEIFGNVDLYVPLFIAGMVVLIDRSAVRAGVAYGFALAVKPLVVVPAAVAVLTRRWRLLGAVVAVVAVLSLPALVFAGVGGFFTHTLPFLASGEPDRIIQVQSVAINSVLRDQASALRFGLRVVGLAAGVMTCLTLWRRDVRPGVRWLEVTVAGQVTLAMISGFAFAHHLAVALLLLPAAAARESLARRPSVCVSLLVLALPRPLPLPSWTIQEQQLLAMALLLIAMAGEAVRARRSGLQLLPEAYDSGAEPGDGGGLRGGGERGGDGVRVDLHGDG